MAKSMTGFGRARVRGKGLEIEAEIRSVNHRHLQVRQRLPEEFSRFESEIEEQIRQKLRRGAVNVTVSATRARSAPRANLRIDLAKRYLDQLRKLKKELRLEGEATVDRLISLPGVLEMAESEPRGSEGEFKQLRAALDQALKALDAARVREGKALEKDLLKRQKLMSALCAKVSERAPQLAGEHRDRLRQRVEDLLRGGSTTVREEDLAREVAIFATRTDIAEELTRLKTHLVEFARLVQSNGEVGRQLDFLLQEMTRETNTLGSKASDAAIAHAVIEMKGEVERMREQVQNLE